MPKHAALFNSILHRLPRKELRLLFPKLKLVALPLHSVLSEASKPVLSAYFLRDGLASILTVLAIGKSVEVGLIGSEGFVGIPLLAGLRSSSTRVIVQVAGSAYRISARDMNAALARCPVLRANLHRFAQAIAAQSAQFTACNRLHNANQRLARWLLMSQDRLGGHLVPLTHEFLAHMLGMRRASVTVALGYLEKAGFIAYRRGAAKIEDRRGLEAASCECYAAILRNEKRWEREFS